MHREYRRTVEHSDRAVLFIHGIVGTPNHFRNFVPLVPDALSVYNILLDGHGRGAADFSKTSMEKWREQVAGAVAELSQNHKEIYVVAHSLGCLLAVEQAVNTAKITKLFLLAVPLKLALKPKMFVTSLKVYLDRIDPKNPELVAAKECCGVAGDKNPLHYIGWIPRFLELFAQIRKVRQMMPLLDTPTFAYQSARDEMVSGKAGKLLRENENITVTELKHSGHYYYDPQDFAFLKEEFSAFVS